MAYIRYYITISRLCQTLVIFTNRPLGQLVSLLDKENQSVIYKILNIIFLKVWFHIVPEPLGGNLRLSLQMGFIEPISVNGSADFPFMKKEVKHEITCKGSCIQEPQNFSLCADIRTDIKKILFFRNTLLGRPWHFCMSLLKVPFQPNFGRHFWMSLSNITFGLHF